MEQRLKKLLQELGLDALEQATYLATLRIGGGTATEVSTHVGQHRITVYEGLKRLHSKGFVRLLPGKKKNGKRFECIPFEVIVEQLEVKRSQLDHLIAGAEHMNKELSGLYAQDEAKPAVFFYEGKQGIKNVLLDTLRSPVTEIVSFAPLELLESSLGLDFLEQYWQRRVQEKIPSRGIMPATKRAKEFMSDRKNQQELRKVKFADPLLYNLKNEVDVYGNNVGIISTQPGNEYGIIIRSETVAESLRSVYETLWNHLEQ